MIRRGQARSVAVFDANLPPGMAFIRSLGQAGIRVTAYSPKWNAAGRFSRYVAEFRRCPDLHRSDEFVAWLSTEIDSGRIDLVAPTSDYVSFHVAEARERVNDAGTHCTSPSATAIRDCLFKDRFVTAMTAAGFPVPTSATPTSLADAETAADKLGYPLVLKPRSHVGVGVDRGLVVRSENELQHAFVRYQLPPGQECVLRYDHQLEFPMLQAYFEPHAVDVISITGCLGQNGEVLALGHSRKLKQWPPRLGIGTTFEAVPQQTFTDHAVEAIRRVLGAGLFELEVLVDRITEEYWAIDLNPRGFGQIALDIARGRDLPLLWYHSITGVPVRPQRPSRRMPRYWREGVGFYTGAAIQLTRGPNRLAQARSTARLIASPAVGAAMRWDDPLPGFVLALETLRHPRALVRPFLQDRT